MTTPPTRRTYLSFPSLTPRHRHETLPATNPQPLAPAPTHTITLTPPEVHHIFSRRLRNRHLPDDAHTVFAESFTSFLTCTTSFAAKFYLLRNQFLILRRKRPILSRCLRLLALSQLRPIRLLLHPLLRILRPLQWVLVPFASMSVPVAVDLSLELIMHILTPALPRLIPQRPKLVDNLISTAEQVSLQLHQSLEARADELGCHLQQAFENAKLAFASPPHLPDLPALFAPESNTDQHQQQDLHEEQSHHGDASSEAASEGSSSVSARRPEKVITTPVKGLSMFGRGSPRGGLGDLAEIAKSPNANERGKSKS